MAHGIYFIIQVVYLHLIALLLLLLFVVYVIIYMSSDGDNKLYVVCIYIAVFNSVGCYCYLQSSHVWPFRQGFDTGKWW